MTKIIMLTVLSIGFALPKAGPVWARSSPILSLAVTFQYGQTKARHSTIIVRYGQKATVIQGTKPSVWSIEILPRRQGKGIVAMNFLIKQKTSKGWQTMTKPRITTRLGRTATITTTHKHQPPLRITILPTAHHLK